MKKKEASGSRGAASRERAEESAVPRSFEQALERLEQIVERLEGGEETLEDSVRLYEEATRLWRFCEEQMRAAQERVEKLEVGVAPADAEEPDELEA